VSHLVTPLLGDGIGTLGFAVSPGARYNIVVTGDLMEGEYAGTRR
jgi:hypothetical protein